MNKASLNNKCIYELRIIGRELGVKAPTTLKKKALINAILNRLENKTQPFFSNRGRPPISNVNTEQADLKEQVENIKANALKQVKIIFDKAQKDIIKVFDNLT